MSLLQDFRFNASVLDHASWQEITPRLVGLVQWMNDHQELKQVLDDLKNKGPVYERLQIGGPGAEIEAARAAGSPRDIAALGLAMAERCSVPGQPQALHQIAASFGIK